MTNIFVDVEAYGFSPVNGKMTEFGAVEAKTGKSFHGKLWESSPDPANPAIPLPTGKRAPGFEVVMDSFALWLKAFGDRPIFISDNPAYDFMWIAGAFDEYGFTSNPFGHSGRRISDFYAGLTGNWSNTQKWKRLRITPHTHNPVDDARGNVEAWQRLMKGER